MFRPLFSLFVGTFLLAACETASTMTEEATGTSGASSSSAAASSSSEASTASSSSSASSAASAEETALEKARGELMSIGDTVLFAFDSSQLSSDAMATLDRQAAFER